MMIDPVVIRNAGLAWLLVLGIVLPCQAQTFGRVGDIEARGTAYHVYARPGDATVQVLVMGIGGGIYEVTDGTRLDELLALVGGTGGTELGGEMPTIRRRTTVRLYRGTGGRRSLIYEAPLEEMLLQTDQHPRLQDGDLFLVETITRNRFGFREGVQLVGGLASLALLVERLGRRF